LSTGILAAVSGKGGKLGHVIYRSALDDDVANGNPGVRLRRVGAGHAEVSPTLDPATPQHRRHGDGTGQAHGVPWEHSGDPFHRSSDAQDLL
jgi:hypothetical protein